jgi:hypothetical protein
VTGEESAALRRALGRLQSSGILLVADARLPSVAGLVAKAPLRGSWWAHPQAHAIYRVAGRLASHPDVLTARLLSGKLTYVHRKLWPELFAVATAQQPWQLRGLRPLARALFASIKRKGRLRIDQLTELRGALHHLVQGGAKAKVLGAAARELEKRLLLYGESIHTERGSHTKQLESWEHVAKRVRWRGRRVTPAIAKERFEQVATALKAGFGTTVQLPWKKI